MIYIYLLYFEIGILIFLNTIDLADHYYFHSLYFHFFILLLTWEIFISSFDYCLSCFIFEFPARTQTVKLMMRETPEHKYLNDTSNIRPRDIYVSVITDHSGTQQSILPELTLLSFMYYRIHFYLFICTTSYICSYVSSWLTPDLVIIIIVILFVTETSIQQIVSEIIA